MKYLVIGSGGPGFTSQEETVKVLKEIEQDQAFLVASVLSSADAQLFSDKPYSDFGALRPVVRCRYGVQ